MPLRGSKGLAVSISLSSKKEFVKLKVLQSGQPNDMKSVLVVCIHSHVLHSIVYISIFGCGQNGLLCGYLGRPCGKCHRVQNNLNNAMCQGFGKYC